MVGAIADKDFNNIIEFVVSREKVMTYKKFTRTNSVRYAKHDILGKKPISEYVGSDLDTVSYSIQLLAQNGLNPREVMNKLIYLQRDGTIVSVFVGDTTMGMFRWVIKGLTNEFDIIDNKGNILGISIDIDFEEYL